MKKSLILSFILVATFVTVQAQRNEVVAAAGDYFKSSTGSVSWTLGELATETYSAQSKTLTQGFQQSRTGFVTAVYDSYDQGVAVYPNPTADQLYLYTDRPAGLSYQLYSLVGVVLDQQAITQPETLISLNGLAPTIYLLQVKRGASIISIFRVVKK